MTALVTERGCCLLVLNTVTSTPKWIRQPKPRGDLADGEKEIRDRRPHHDDGDSHEESETSEMSGTSSEKRRLDCTREALREAGPEALRMAARRFGPE